jgi:hypothetical protein
MIRARGWKDGSQPIRRGEVNWIIKTRIGAHSALKSTESINLAEKLDLEPSVAYLHGSAWLEHSR